MSMLEIWTALDTLAPEIQATEKDVSDSVSSLRQEYRTLEENLLESCSEVDEACRRQSADGTRRLGDIEGKATDWHKSLKAQIDEKRPKLQSKPGGPAKLQAAEDQLENTRKTREADLDKAKKDVAALVAPIQEGVALVRTQVAPQIVAAIAVIDQRFKGPSGDLSTLRKTIKTTVTSLKDDTRPKVQAVIDAIKAGRAQIDPPLEKLGPLIDTEQKRLEDTSKDMKDALLKPIDILQTEVDGRIDGFFESTKGARASLMAAKQAMDKIAKEAGDAIDLFVEKAYEAQTTILATIEAILAPAYAVLDQVKAALAQLDATVAATLAPLLTLMADLTKLFEDAIALLKGLLAKGIAILEAIPANALPKAMVKPAIGSITQAVGTAAQQIATAASQAGDQIKSLARTIVGNVAQVQKQIVDKIGDFRAQVLQQVEEAVKPIRTQMAAVQKQLDDAMKAIVKQITSLRIQVCGKIDEMKEKLRAEINKVVDTVLKAIETVEDTIAAAFEKADVALAEAKTTLTTAVKNVTDGIQTAIQKGDDAISKVYSDGMAVLDKIETEASTFVKAQRETFGKMLSKIREVIRTIVQELKLIVSRAKQELQAPVKRFAAEIGRQDLLDVPLKAVELKIGNDLDRVQAAVLLL